MGSNQSYHVSSAYVDIDDEPLYCITYMSDYCGSEIKADLAHILSSSRKNNNKRAISGILLVDNHVFMQVLEGPKSLVTGCFEQITQDCRHQNVLCVREELISIRTFADWSMAFASVHDLGSFQQESFTQLRDLIVCPPSEEIYKDQRLSFLVRNFFSTVAVPVVSV